MPRDATQVLANVQLFASPAAITNSAAPVAGLAAIGAEIEQPYDPLLFIVSLPTVTISTLNAVLSLNIYDITGAGQQLCSWAIEGITAAGNAGPPALILPYIPALQATVNPTLAGPRTFQLIGVTTAGTATLVAAANAPISFLILDLARR